MGSTMKGLKNLVWLFGLQFSFSCADSSTTLSIATGGPAGLYYPIGGGMASIWSAHVPGDKCEGGGDRRVCFQCDTGSQR